MYYVAAAATSSPSPPAPGYRTQQREWLAPEQVDSDRHPRDPAILGFRESLASWVSAKRECDALRGVPFVTQVT